MNKKPFFSVLCMAFLLGGASPAKGEDFPQAPLEWACVHTNQIEQWKKAHHAPTACVVDAHRHRFTFLIEATGIPTNAPAEFLVIGPLSDRAYEAVFVSVATPACLAHAAEQIGLPRGCPIDVKDASFWPQGEGVSLHFARVGQTDQKVKGLDEVLTDTRRAEEGAILKRPVIWTGGARTSSGHVVASTNMPCALFALYSHAPSFMQLREQCDQTSMYGRFTSAQSLTRGDLFTCTLTWDGTRRVAARALSLSLQNLTNQLAEVRACAQTNEVFVRVGFEEHVTLREAVQLAQVLDLLDGKAVRVNGSLEGSYYYRSFLPDPAWRTRARRPFQPFEVRWVSEGQGLFTFVEEDWSGEGLDPVLKPQTRNFSSFKELPRLIEQAGEQGEKVRVLFVEAPENTPVAVFKEIRKILSARIDTFYFFCQR